MAYRPIQRAPQPFQGDWRLPYNQRQQQQLQHQDVMTQRLGMARKAGLMPMQRIGGDMYRMDPDVQRSFGQMAARSIQPQSTPQQPMPYQPPGQPMTPGASAKAYAQGLWNQTEPGGPKAGSPPLSLNMLRYQPRAMAPTGQWMRPTATGQRPGARPQRDPNFQQFPDRPQWQPTNYRNPASMPIINNEADRQAAISQMRMNSPLSPNREMLLGAAQAASQNMLPTQHTAPLPGQQPWRPTQNNPLVKALQRKAIKQGR